MSTADSSTGRTATDAASGPDPQQVLDAVRKARGSLGRYRFMALLTGTMLLVLCAEMIYKYLLVDAMGVSGALLLYIEWVPFAHGWIYVVYLVAVLDLWVKMRWGFGRLLTLVLAGVVPVMSFVLEKRVVRDVGARLDALEASRTAQGGPGSDG